MAMTFVRHIKLVIACVVVIVHISTITAATKSWTKSEFPNPQIDVDDCGNNGKKSWVCDPARLLKREDVDALNEMIIQLRGEYSCQGWVAAVAVVPRIRLTDNVNKPIDGEELSMTRTFADYLLTNSWTFGNCSTDLVIVISDKDKTVWTSTSNRAHGGLPEDCVDDIYEEGKHYFTEQNYAKGLSYLLEQYRRVLLTEERKCKGSSWDARVVGGSSAGVVLLILIIIVAVYCTGGCGLCS